jgi:hypothetical protein
MFTNVIDETVGFERRKTIIRKQIKLDNFYKSTVKSIVVEVFEEYYSVIIERSSKVGDLRKMLGTWIDINPVNISIYSKKRKLSDAQNVWGLTVEGCLDFQTKLEREAFQNEDYKVINSHKMSCNSKVIIFKWLCLYKIVLVSEQLKRLFYGKLELMVAGLNSY